MKGAQSLYVLFTPCILVKYMSSNVETTIKDLQNLLEKEFLPKLESINSNLELIAESTIDQDRIRERDEAVKNIKRIL